MTTSAAEIITALRSEHDALASVVATLSPEQLTTPSGASEWTVADVLSHLGSGAEITLASLRAGLGEAEAPGADFNQGVWDRWNALSPQDQAAGWAHSDEALVAALEAVPQERHEEIKVDMGFLPEPLPLATFAAMRLSEVVPHTWDVRAGLDAGATLPDGSAELLAQHLSTDLAFLLGFIGKPTATAEPAVIEVAKTSYHIVLDEKAQFTTEAPAATAKFTGSLEAALRLLYGRLTPAHTPNGTSVDGNITLNELRAVFPGF
ncbi:hypothetical protein Kisp01_19360 [Kineosporia sp. NBRC 101677]|uniref:maleylpyruvate isomerase family mycothiol-dependent enzyme n=1 Tax=Kineosporia sp. NBRC 101677 TaxID=3032197 RepID=UPI0024A5AE0F|nr:maleylpyruvate isomerase family mycothiol-dependent enzyme [Kineosporia sp. NBRC 101677]GLY14921.1 hypothetical protein Kisp01_19360 [Kineosporia sp. NBRC 101677]